MHTANSTTVVKCLPVPTGCSLGAIKSQISPRSRDGWFGSLAIANNCHFAICIVLYTYWDMLFA